MSFVQRSELLLLYVAKSKSCYS